MTVKEKIKKIPLVEKVEGTVLVKRFKSKTPRTWKIIGEVSATLVTGGILAAASITPAGWLTWGTWIGVGVFSLIGTISGYQTDNQELKNLWKKPFSLFKKAKG